MHGHRHLHGVVPSVPPNEDSIDLSTATFGEAFYAYLSRVVARGSSDVDWCEANYASGTRFDREFVAEYYNTWSNVVFFLLPPVLIYLFRPYARIVGNDVQVVWVLLMVVGAGSGYFHATLSFSGQMIDELAILYVFMAALAFWMPRHWLLGQSRKRVKVIMTVASAVATALGFVYPKANAFLLMLGAIPTVTMIVGECRRTSEWTVWRLAFASMGWWLFAIDCWLNDKLFCDVWNGNSLGFVTLGNPQLHSWWHVLIFLAAYTGCVLAAFFYAQAEYPHLKPQLTYWPKRDFEMGVPYVELHMDGGDRDGAISISMRKKISSTSLSDMAHIV